MHYTLIFESSEHTSFTSNGVYDVVELQDVMIRGTDVLGMRIAGAIPVVSVDGAQCGGSQVVEYHNNIIQGFTYQFQNHACMDLVAEMLFELGMCMYISYM